MDGPGEYSLEVTFKSTPLGMVCQECSEPGEALKLGEDFRFRIWALAESGEEVEMKGATYSIPLPVSKVSTANTKVQTFTVRPFFSQNYGNSEHHPHGSKLLSHFHDCRKHSDVKRPIKV